MNTIFNIKWFRYHLLIYLFFVLVFFGINLNSNTTYVWAVWPTLGWGTGVISHYLLIQIQKKRSKK